MAFGEIYCKTWWGEHGNIVYSLEVPPNLECLLQTEVLDYKVRVLADGGTVEALQCVDRWIYNLKTGL